MFETLVNILSYRHQIQTSVESMELLWQQAHSKAQLSLKNLECKLEAQQIIDLISTHMKKLESYGVQIASNTIHTETLKEEYVAAMYGPAMALIEHADGVIQSLKKLEGSKVKYLIRRLCNLKESFSEAVEIPFQILESICDYNFLFDKVAGWYNLVLVQISFKHALWSEMSAKLGFTNSMAFINPVWKDQVCRFLIQYSSPDPKELLRLSQLSDGLSELHPEIQRQHATLLSQRCHVLLNLLMCNGKVLLSDLQQAIHWQENLIALHTESFFTGNVQTDKKMSPVLGIVRSEKGLNKSNEDGSSFSMTLTHVKCPEGSASQGYTCSMFDKDMPILQNAMHEMPLLQSKAFQNVITEKPPKHSLNCGILVADQSLKQSIARSSDKVPVTTHCKSEEIASRTNTGCMISKDILESFSIMPSGIDDLTGDVNEKLCANLPDNPWLSLPLEDLKIPYDFTIAPSNSSTEHIHGVCHLCCVQLKDQSTQASVFTDVSTDKLLKTKSAEIQVSEVNLKSIFARQDSAVQTDENVCYKLSDILNHPCGLSPVKMVLCSTFNNTQEDAKDLTPSIGWDSYEPHLSRRLKEECHGIELLNGMEWLFSDWEIKERDDLHDIEKLLEKAENILREEECAFKQEREIDLLLQNEVQYPEKKNGFTSMQSRMNIYQAMSPKELSDAGVIGIEELWPDGAQHTSKNMIDLFMDNKHRLASPGCLLSKENIVALQPQHSNILLEELEELYAIEAKIWDENLKLDELRELELRGKVKDHNSLLNLTKERLSFLVELQRERNEVEELEQSVAKENAKKKQNLRNIVDMNKRKKQHHVTSGNTGTSPSKSITPLANCLKVSSSRMFSASKNSKEHNDSKDMNPDTVGMFDTDTTMMLRLENKSVAQGDDHSAFLASTACKEQDRRIVEGSESTTKEAPITACITAKSKMQLPPSVKPVKKCPKHSEHSGFLATGKLVGPVAKPRKAVLAMYPAHSFEAEVLSNQGNLRCKEHSMQGSVHICRTERNLKEKEVNIEVTLNMSPADIPKPEAYTDIGGEIKSVKLHRSAVCKCRQGNTNCTKFEKCVDQVLHCAPKKSDFKSGTFPQVTVKWATLKAKANTLDDCNHIAIADVHSRQRKPKCFAENAGSKSKKLDLIDLLGVSANGSCSTMPSKKHFLERCHLQVSSMKLSDYRTPIVLDIGSGLMKAGFANQDLPITVFPTVIGLPKDKGTALKGFEDEIYIGHEAQHTRSTLTLKDPIHHGTVTDWNELEKIWHYTFYNQLRVNPEEHPVMLTETAMNRQSKSQMVQIMFEVFNVPLAFVAMQAVLALYSSGRTTGIVFSSGDEVSYSVPVYEGYALPHAIQQVNLAGRDLTDYLRKLLEGKGLLQVLAKQEVVRDIKEKCCYVAEDTEVEQISYVPYTLPDGQTITLGEERFRASEVFFQPQLIGKQNYGVHESLFRSLLLSDVDLRKTFAGNIVLSGGSTRLPGFPLRLQKEVSSMVPLDLLDSVSVASLPDQYFAVWSGGAALASSPTFDTAWISKEEYFEFGSDIVYKRCF